jgi:hypothetical protein
VIADRRPLLIGRLSSDIREASSIKHRSYIISHRSDLGRVLDDGSLDTGRLSTRGRSAEASVNYNSDTDDTDASSDVPPVSGRRPMTL